MIPIIGLTGEPGKQAGVGKDTVANFMCEFGGYKAIALAEPIKLAVCAMFGLTLDYFDDRDKKETPLPEVGVSPRYLAQTLGTEWGRKVVRDDLWFRLADQRARQERAWGFTPVVTDVRFDNEADWIREQGGVVVRIHRPAVPHVEAHASEAGVSNDRIDYTLHNGGDLTQLGKAVQDLVGRIESDTRSGSG